MDERIELKTQVNALQKLQERLGYDSQRKMAAALQDVSFSTLSRWMSFDKPQAISKSGRLALARLLGHHHSDEDGLEETLRVTGWTLTDNEWLEAVRHFKVSASPAFPRLAADRFVGRVAEITVLRAALLARGAAAPLLVVVTGAPGTGKSALVQRVAGETAIQQRFTGGCFWLRLEGLDAEAAQREFLAQAAPNATRCEPRAWLRDARAALGGRPALIVLDGVTEPLALDDWLRLAQGSGGRIVVTTQRADLSSEAWPERGCRVALDMLDTPEARVLLTRGIAVQGPEEEAAVERLLRALAGLPLALDLANRNAAVDNSFRLLAAEVTDDALATLTAPPAQSLLATFRAAYHRLDADAAELFRSLGGFPQPFQVPACAAVLQWPEAVASRAARTLARQGLIQGTAGNYTMHRLLQAFALEQARAEDQAHFTAWESRFAEYYLGVARAAGIAWARGDEATALAAWRASLPHIAAGFRYAAQAGQADWVVDYLKHVAPYLGLSGQADLVAEWQATFAALTVADPGQRAWGLQSLAEAHLWLNQPAAAIPLLEAARAACAAAADQQLWLPATLTLGQAHLAAGREDAAHLLIRDADFSRALSALPGGDPLRTQAWGLVGVAQHTQGRWEAAAAAYRRALAAGQESGAGPWQLGRLWLGLGEVLLAAEQFAAALEACEAGLAATQAAGPDYLWGALAAESAIALAQLNRKSEAEARLAATQERAGADPRLAGLLAFARAEVAWDAAQPHAGELAYRQAALACSGTPLIADIELRLAERLAESGRPRRAAFALDAARHDGYLTGNRRAMITALLRGGAYLLERGETDQGGKLLTQAVEAGAGRGYDDLAADALALLDHEAEAQALRLRAAAETVKASLPGLSLRLELVGSTDGHARPWPTGEPDPAVAEMGVVLAQALLGQIAEDNTP